MKIIDFDAKFTEILTDWIEKNRSRFRRPEDMEDEVPDVYLKFLNTPANWLDGKTPGEYFDQFDDSQALCDLVCDYIREGVPVPDPLLDPCEARMTAIELLRQVDSRLPMVDFIRWQVDRDEEDDLLDNALESLRQMGPDVVRPAKVAFLAADDEGKEALVDVLADYPGDQDVFDFALNQFKTRKDKRALYAGYLAKLEDDHALEALLDVAEGDDVSYTDFIEIRSAIERLGSEAPVRDWTHDPTYRAFKRLQLEQSRKVTE